MIKTKKRKKEEKKLHHQKNEEKRLRHQKKKKIKGCTKKKIKIKRWHHQKKKKKKGCTTKKIKIKSLHHLLKMVSTLNSFSFSFQLVLLSNTPIVPLELDTLLKPIRCWKQKLAHVGHGFAFLFCNPSHRSFTEIAWKRNRGERERIKATQKILFRTTWDQTFKMSFGTESCAIKRHFSRPIKKIDHINVEKVQEISKLFKSYWKAVRCHACAKCRNTA